jgi:hypothetical protein
MTERPNAEVYRSDFSDAEVQKIKDVISKCAGNI